MKRLIVTSLLFLSCTSNKVTDLSFSQEEFLTGALMSCVSMLAGTLGRVPDTFMVEVCKADALNAYDAVMEMRDKKKTGSQQATQSQNPIFKL